MTDNDNQRKLGFWMCLALVIGNMIGSGVFLLPASLAPYGLNSIFGWLFTAAGSVLLAIVFAQLARVYPQAAGPYHYPRVAFGELTGFIMAWGYWMAVWVGNAAIATGTVAYLAELVPAIKSHIAAPALTSCALIWILTVLNWRGVREMGAVQIVTTVLKIMPLLAVIVLAVVLLIDGDTSVIRVEPQPFAVPAVIASATLTLWAFLGLECATVPAGNVIDPQRTIPRATLWGTIVTTVIYVVACSSVVLLIPSSELAVSTAPFADLIRQYMGTNAGHLLALFAFISGFGALNGWVLVQGEMPRAMARDGVFPAIFAKESRYGTPGISLFITSSLLTVLVLMNYSSSMVEAFTFILLVATSTYLVMYLCCALAALKLALRGDLALAGRKLIWLLAVAILAALYSVFTLYGAGAKAFWWGMALFVAGLPVYIVMRVQRQRAGVLAPKALHGDAGSTG